MHVLVRVLEYTPKALLRLVRPLDGICLAEARKHVLQPEGPEQFAETLRLLIFDLRRGKSYRSGPVPKIRSPRNLAPLNPKPRTASEPKNSFYACMYGT